MLWLIACFDNGHASVEVGSVEVDPLHGHLLRQMSCALSVGLTRWCCRVLQPQWLEHFLERLLERPPQPRAVIDCLLELYLSSRTPSRELKQQESAALGTGSGVIGGVRSSGQCGDEDGVEDAVDEESRERGDASKSTSEKVMRLLRQPQGAYTEEQVML